jgi:CRP-like cAMP-binding protein
MNPEEIHQHLENCEFFKGFEKSEITQIAGLCRQESYDPGDYVFRQGDFGENIYVIAEGQVFLERSINLGTRKGQAVIGVLGRGRVLGCWSTLLDEPHTMMSSANCQKPTTLLALRGSDLREMMLKSASLGFKMLEKLCIVLRGRIEGAYGAMERI